MERVMPGVCATSEAPPSAAAALCASIRLRDTDGFRPIGGWYHPHPRGQTPERRDSTFAVFETPGGVRPRNGATQGWQLLRDAGDGAVGLVGPRQLEAAGCRGAPRHLPPLVDLRPAHGDA